MNYSGLLRILTIFCLSLSGGVACAQGNKGIPFAESSFRGRIDRNFKDSQPSYPSAVKAPAGAPNVLLILLDDVGFGMTGTFGGPVPTPELDKLAAGGLKFNRFHTTGMDSPTRAALLTGRNHHNASTGVDVEMGTGFPGYTGILPRETALISQILQANGYATACFGKWHNTPISEIQPAGPFDRWPTSLGFGSFYGFNRMETNHLLPTLYRNTTAIPAPGTPANGYHLTTDLTNEAIQWIRNVESSQGNSPWFAYFAPGACHAPQHAPAEWREKFKGQFDVGWDRMRKLTFSRQRQGGVIPTDSVLTLRPSEIPAWDDQSVEGRKVAAKLMENCAASMAHTDHEIGRLIDALREDGTLDSTLVIYIVGDQGAGADGGLNGAFNDFALKSGCQPTVDKMAERIDEIGEPASNPNIPLGWAWAMNTPFKWTGPIASHFGAIRNPLVVHWPQGIQSKGETRPQFHHVIDIVPTILEVAGISEPATVNGFPQKPIEGVSMKYAFNNKIAKDQRTSQYFEAQGHRAMYQDGWFACVRHGVPWVSSSAPNRFLTDQWELYDLQKDYTQLNDTAARNPTKLNELKETFQKLADKNNVFPLDDRFQERLDPRWRSTEPFPTNWTYHGNRIRIPEAVSPLSMPFSHKITINTTLPSQDVEGVLACSGGQSGGWTIFIKDGKLAYEYNYFGDERTLFVSTAMLSVGVPLVIQLEFVSNSASNSTGDPLGGVLKFTVNDQKFGELTIPKTTPRFGDEPFEIGRDSISPVSESYADRGDFAFNGIIQKVEFALNQPLPPLK